MLKKLGFLIVVSVSLGLCSCKMWRSDLKDIDKKKTYVVPKEVAQIINKYCLECHDNEVAPSKHFLKGLNLTRVVKRDPILGSEIGKIFYFINKRVHSSSRPMPPQGKLAKDRLTILEKYIFELGAHEPIFNEAEKKITKTDLRRITAFEYRAVVSELLGKSALNGVDVPGTLKHQGFDNDALLNRQLSEYDLTLYLDAARAVARNLTEMKHPIYRLKPYADLVELQARAFRGKQTEFDRKNLMRFIDRFGRNRGTSLAIVSILANPKFLIRVERRGRLSRQDLRNRLFFMFFGSPEPPGYRSQSFSNITSNLGIRVFRDQRSEFFIKRLAHQWFETDFIELEFRDLKIFPKKNPLLFKSYKREIELFLRYLIAENAPIESLINSNLSYQNHTLAKFYEDDYQDPINQFGEFNVRQAKVGSERLGILGLGAMLSATSLSTRTSPTRRGRWVLENLLCEEVEPPPPNIPEFENHEDKPIRQMLKDHAKGVCASCHLRTDPIGLALEQFDAIGSFRTTYRNGRNIDAAGKLHNITFRGHSGLRRALLSKKEGIANCFAQKVLQFGIGRSLTETDKLELKQVVKKHVHSNFLMRDLLASVLNTKAFRN